jgi:predicted metalloendopeptidase
MMKGAGNKAKTMLMALVSASMLTACNDVIGQADNPVQPVNPVDPATELAQETFMHEEWMDRTVKPGDSFWHFAQGGWLKTRDADDISTNHRLTKHINEKLKSNLGNYDSPVAGKLIKLMTQPAPEKSEEVKVINDFLETLKMDGDVSKADLIRNFGKMTDIGCPALVRISIEPIDGQLKSILAAGMPYNAHVWGMILMALQDEHDNTRGISESDYQYFILNELMGLDLSSPEISAEVDKIIEIETKINTIFYDYTTYEEPTGKVRIKQIQPATLQCLNAAGTRAGEDENLKAVFNEAFHVKESTLISSDVDKVLAMLDEYSTDTWLLYMQYYIYGRFQYLFRYTDHFAERGVIKRLCTLAPTATMDYDFAILLEDCDVEGCREMLEKMRQRLGQRIEQLDWLGSDTKAKAQEKLKSMQFMVGKPDRLYNADFVLTGNTAIEASMQYMKQYYDYLRSLDGVPAKGHAWDYVANALGVYTPSAVNAFYVPNCNELVINPAYIMPEMFPTDKNNAQRYATAMVFGHEMTHGFDPQGAQYDANGLKVNWWTDEDMARFKQQQQKMIDRFNELEQAPGLPANGEKTLGENIADQGGVTLAYILWNEQLQAEGLSGEALRHQQRQFFLSYADLWQAYATDAELAKDIKDKHSANHNRVNGIARLTDDWYDLFGVEPGDKLYVAPEDRVKIW